MTIDDRIRDEKLQYDITREEEKISALSSGKIDKYANLTHEEILPANQIKVIKQAKSTYSPLRKGLKKRIKIIEEKGKKQSEALKVLKSNTQKLKLKLKFQKIN